MDSILESNNDAKQVFKDCGTCSRTFAHLLNREFGHVNVHQERALNPLAGGIMNLGYQCGMLWGASLAVGAEAYRQHQDLDKAIAVTLSATKKIVDSFEKRSNTSNCKEIIGYDLTRTFDMARFMLKVTLQGMNNSHCFNLAEQWAPEAVQTANEGIFDSDIQPTETVTSCASEVIKRLGGTDEEAVLVSGFSGGLGLSGNACGALSAAIWKKMFDWCIENPTKDPPFFNNKTAKKIVKKFKTETNSEMRCDEICGRKFNSIGEHSDYIKNGGCKKIIEILSHD